MEILDWLKAGTRVAFVHKVSQSSDTSRNLKDQYLKTWQKICADAQLNPNPKTTVCWATYEAGFRTDWAGANLATTFDKKHPHSQDHRWSFWPRSSPCFESQDYRNGQASWIPYYPTTFSSCPWSRVWLGFVVSVDLLLVSPLNSRVCGVMERDTIFSTVLPRHLPLTRRCATSVIVSDDDSDQGDYLVQRTYADIQDYFTVNEPTKLSCLRVLSQSSLDPSSDVSCLPLTLHQKSTESCFHHHLHQASWVFFTRYYDTWIWFSSSFWKHPCDPRFSSSSTSVLLYLRRLLWRHSTWCVCSYDSGYQGLSDDAFMDNVDLDLFPRYGATITTPSSHIIHMIYDNYTWTLPVESHFVSSVDVSLRPFQEIMFQPSSQEVRHNFEPDKTQCHLDFLLICTMLTVSHTMLLFWNLFSTLVSSVDTWSGIYSLINALFATRIWVTDPTLYTIPQIRFYLLDCRQTEWSVCLQSQSNMESCQHRPSCKCTKCMVFYNKDDRGTWNET